ncbi:MAG TPA: alpha-L-fucosidase [Plantibacter sp.]|uniref:alpha-L-fucosidase n=1 Tax=unclassified Plantibacter TaxID=2624265 RepID=UPI002B52D76F|nr:alpha-L-fucosidase [Plantibacter sp.]
MSEITIQPPDDTWFDDARFGLFLHWGLYALPARHEWVQSREHLSAEHYERYREHFDPDLFQPREWARRARAAGFRYAVLTTKHHDGFCLWDSALTEFTSMHTPAGRDLVAEFVDAFRAEALRIGFYHSLIDWHHPDFTVDGIHPRRDDPAAITANTDRRWPRYREYLHGQVRELLTHYGQIDYLFFDFSYSQGIEGLPGKGATDWGSIELVEMIRELQPNILINDRLEVPGDVTTPEQYQPASTPTGHDGAPIRWEACQTLNGSWGYDRDNLDYKSAELLLKMLVDSVSKNGNMLLNIGPTARGTIDPRAIERLDVLAAWFAVNERSIRGCGPSQYASPTDVRYTQRGDRLYVHVFSWPFVHLHLPALAGRVRYAQLLSDGSEVPFRVHRPEHDLPNQHTQPKGPDKGTVTLHLPVATPAAPVPVIEIFLQPVQSPSEQA